MTRLVKVALKTGVGFPDLRPGAPIVLVGEDLTQQGKVVARTMATIAEVIAALQEIQGDLGTRDVLNAAQVADLTRQLEAATTKASAVRTELADVVSANAEVASANSRLATQLSELTAVAEE